MKSLDLVVEFVKNDTAHFAWVFVRLKTSLFHLQDNLDQKFDEALLRVDVIHVHELLAKE